jgi:hypothetical protein
VYLNSYLKERDIAQFFFFLMAINTSLCMEVRGVVISLENISRSQIDPFVFLLDALGMTTKRWMAFGRLYYLILELKVS